MKYSEVKYQPERSKSYIGSPSLVRLPDGALLASHDYFGCLFTLENENGLTSIYRSEDNGQTWLNITHIINAYWGTMISLPDAVYHIGVTRDYGDIVVRRSTDGGFTWSTPVDEKSGVIVRGTPPGEPRHFRIETSGTELVHEGRIYKAYDVHPIEPGRSTWSPGLFETGIMSAPIGKDLLDASNWTLSNRVRFDAEKYGDPGVAQPGDGWLEGSPVPGPGGRIYDLIRMHLRQPNKVGILALDDEGRKLSFDYRDGIIDFVGGASRFTVRKDPVTGLYVTFSNPVDVSPEGKPLTHRNVLALAVSPDLRQWRRVRDVLTDDTGMEAEYSRLLTGFQYCAWHFDGDDIILLSRSAYRGAHNYHDANRLTFHRFGHWREWL